MTASTQAETLARYAPVLVTGGAGFLGCNLIERLAGLSIPVIVLDSLARPGVEANLAWLRRQHGGYLDVRRADIRDEKAVRRAVADAGAVLHLAAQVAVTTSVDDPIVDFEVNARGTLNVLEAIRHRATPIPLVFASTNKVYGQLAQGDGLRLQSEGWAPADPALAGSGVSERQPLDLHSPYGCSKGAADQYVLDYARVFGLPTLVLRMSCLYGPHQRGSEDQGWVAHFLIRMLERRPITLFGDGQQVRDVLFVADAVDAWLGGLAAIDRLAGRAFNLGGGPGLAVSLRTMLEHLQALTGRPAGLRHAASRPGDQAWYVSDTRALEAATGWRPRVSLGQGLAELHRWLTAPTTSATADPRVPA